MIIGLKQIVLIGLLLYSALLLFLYFQQKKFIFFPTRAHHEAPQHSVEFTLRHDNVVLQGWLFQEKYAPDRLIFYYGGNAEDIYYAVEQFQQYGDTAALFVNYRGYGASTGSPGQQEIFKDALAVFDEVTQRYRPKKVFVMGRSLGSGVAGHVASRRPVDGAILITPFDSIEAIAGRRFFFLPVSLLLRHPFRLIDSAAQFTAPSLIIYGGNDSTVLPAQTERLIENIRGEKKSVLIEDAEHNNIDMFDRYHLEILQFIQ
ncbi:MAG: alpha/beta hydrolase [Desulfopila sp.]